MTRIELLAAMAAVGCAGSLAALVVAQGTRPVRAERLPGDTEWKEHRFGFNARPENAEDSSSQRYVVHF